MKWILLWIICPAFVWARFEAPHSMTGGRTDLITRSLFEGCFSINPNDTAMGLPCNPAFLGNLEQERVRFQIFASNNVHYFRDVYNILNYKANTSAVHRLFSQTRDARLEADAEVHYQKDNWAFSFSPTRISYYTLIRNEVLPYISVYASHEQVLRGQMSWNLTSDLKFGVQARILNRTFILSEFFVTDAVVEDARIVKAQYQSAAYLEPGLVWAPANFAMEPQISATVTQLGVTSKRYAGLPDDPEAEFGASFKTDTAIGIVRFGPHFSFNSDYKNLQEQLRVSAIYELDRMKYLASIKASALDIGAYFEKKKFNGGIVFDFENVENLRGKDDNVFTWAIQIGYEI